jgi:hypothetical protein
VHDELPFLCQENARLGLLLDNHDDMLREAKKVRKELRALLEDDRTRLIMVTHLMVSSFFLHLWVLPSSWVILLRRSPSSLSSLWMASQCEWLSPL